MTAVLLESYLVLISSEDARGVQIHLLAFIERRQLAEGEALCQSAAGGQAVQPIKFDARAPPAHSTASTHSNRVLAGGLTFTTYGLYCLSPCR